MTPPRAVKRATSMAVIVLVAMLVTDCDNTPPPASVVEVRDSAGIKVVESSGPLWGGVERWRISGQPLLQIGTADGSGDFIFSGVSGGVMLPDGGFVVADASRSIRKYNSEGELRWRLGRRGEGPGEFTGRLRVDRRANDTIIVLDATLNRVSIIDPDGRLARLVNLPAAASGGATQVMAAPDGSFLVAVTQSSALLPNAPQVGRFREAASVFRFTSGGEALSTLGPFPAAEWDIFAGSISRSLFSHNARFALRDTVLVVATGDELQVEIYSFAGALLEINRVPSPDLSVSDADVRKVHDWFLDAAGGGDARRGAAARIAQMSVPTRRPAYSDVFADPDGFLWLPGYRFPGYSDDRLFVFGPDGKFLGRMTIPPSFRLLDVGSGSVLGVWRDSLDVPYIRVYEIVK